MELVHLRVHIEHVYTEVGLMAKGTFSIVFMGKLPINMVRPIFSRSSRRADAASDNASLFWSLSLSVSLSALASLVGARPVRAVSLSWSKDESSKDEEGVLALLDLLSLESLGLSLDCDTLGFFLLP